MHLLYPKSLLRPNQPDEQFAAEVDAVRSAGLGVSIFSINTLPGGGFTPPRTLPKGEDVLYRGWMLSASEFEAFVSCLEATGVRTVVSVKDYLATHYLSNWYPHIKDLTPETRIYPTDCDLQAELRPLNWPEYFIKDYVKSLKTSLGSRISNLELVPKLIAEMRHFRGDIEGGFCVRRVEPFLPDTEKRYFVIDRKPHAASGEVPPIVCECANRLTARFYSVDIAQRSDRELRIVEVGDGQVSDLVGWTPEAFAKMLAEHFGKETEA
jgi:hypothetical protein